MYMITRKFEQEWDSSVSPINNMVQKDVLEDFLKYSNRLHNDLFNLIKYQKEEFYALSNIDLEEYKEKLYKLRNYFVRMIFLPNEYYDNGFTIFYKQEKLRPDVLTVNGNHFKINKKYYKQLNKIANQIFALEDELAPIVEKLWQNKLSNISDYSSSGEYSLLAHAEYGPINYDDYSAEMKEYCENQQGMCFSLITDQKTKLYNQDKYWSEGIVGIIAKPKKDGFLVASYFDMLSTEYYKGECNFEQHFDHSDVNCVYRNGDNKICSYGTRICPPNAIMETDIDEINEVVLDKKLIDVEAIFYVKTAAGKIPEKLEAYYEKCKKEYGKELSIIEVKKRNKLYQYNLEDAYH